MEYKINLGKRAKRMPIRQPTDRGYNMEGTTNLSRLQIKPGILFDRNHMMWGPVGSFHQFKCVSCVCSRKCSVSMLYYNVGSFTHSFPLLGGAGSPEQPILGQRGLQAHTFPFQHFSSHFCRNYLISLITDMGTHHFPFGNYLNFAFHTFLSKIPINHTDTSFLPCSHSSITADTL